MPYGLTPRQLRELRAEYGSLAAAATARPDLAKQLQAVQEAGDQMDAVVRALHENQPPLLATVPEPERILAPREIGKSDSRMIGRPPHPLPQSKVLKAEKRLKKRVALSAKPRSGPLTHMAIAAHAGLTRDRVDQFEQLLRMGWSLRESHPDFPAAAGFVRLPTPHEAARLLGSR
jgi:hypothetical protein